MTTLDASAVATPHVVPAAGTCGCTTVCEAPKPFGGDEELHSLAKQLAALPPEKAQQLRDFLIQQTAG